MVTRGARPFLVVMEGEQCADGGVQSGLLLTTDPPFSSVGEGGTEIHRSGVWCHVPVGPKRGVTALCRS